MTAYGQGRVGSGGGVTIPVVHLDSPTYYPSRSGIYPSTTSPSPGSYRNGVLRKPISSPPISLSTDPEAEVDALTDALMQKMEAPRSAGVMSPIELSSEGLSSSCMCGLF